MRRWPFLDGFAFGAFIAMFGRMSRGYFEPRAAISKLRRIWSTCPEGTIGKIQGESMLRMASICSPTCSIDHEGRYTPGDSAIAAFATRPAMAISISPVIEHDS